MTTTRRLVTSLVAGALLAGGALFASAQAMAGSDQAGVTTPTAADSSLATELAFARDEERMARDLYTALADRYDAGVFAMLARSEQQHFQAVGTLLDRYDVADPADGKKPGTYADPAIQKLYDSWLADGKASLDAAYDVGVALEKRDIADLRKSLAGDLPTDATRVLTALLTASQHHLAVFEAAADGRFSGTQQGQGGGYGMGMMGGQGNGYGMGMMNGWRNGSGTGGALDGTCPMLDDLTD